MITELVGHLIDPVGDGINICQIGIRPSTEKGQAGIENILAPAGGVEAMGIIPIFSGAWEPCFKEGPCPCASPCRRVVALTPPGGA